MVTTEAPMIPVQAAKTMQTAMTASPTPPRKGPNNTRKALNNSSATPDMVRKLPMRMKRVMATRTKLSMVP